jgi:hypothetical protein
MGREAGPRSGRNFRYLRLRPKNRKSYVHISQDGGASRWSGTNVLFEGLHHVNTLNREEIPVGTEEGIRWLTGTLRKGCEKHGLSPDPITPFEGVIPAFARIDRLAVISQIWHLNAGAVIALLATLAVATVTAQVLFLPDHPEVFWLEFIEMAAVLGTIFLSWRGGVAQEVD